MALLSSYIKIGGYSIKIIRAILELVRLKPLLESYQDTIYKAPYLNPKKKIHRRRKKPQNEIQKTRNILEKEVITNNLLSVLSVAGLVLIITFKLLSVAGCWWTKLLPVYT